MKTPPKPQPQPNIFSGIRNKILIWSYFFWTATIILLILFILDKEIRLDPKATAGIGALLMVSGAVLGTFFDVLLELPGIATEFDKIKNDIAFRKIKTPEDFSHRVVKLLCEFIRNKPFFTAAYAFMKIDRSPYVYSDNSLLDHVKIADFEKFLAMSKETEVTIYTGPVQISGSRYHIYITPIWFGDTWHGLIGVVSPRKLLPIFKNFLSVFEDDHLDDQLVHVLDISKQMAQKQFYRDIDEFSNKISKNVYGKLREYQDDILRYLVERLDCQGGVFLTVYEDAPAHFFRQQESKGAQAAAEKALEYFSNRPSPASAQIYSDPNVDFSFVFAIPILIDEPQGVIYLLDSTDENFRYFDRTLREIEDIKLDNDLENLAYRLNLSSTS